MTAAESLARCLYFCAQINFLHLGQKVNIISAGMVDEKRKIGYSLLGDSMMNEEKIGPVNLLDTTDCLEAIGVFRGWKNFLFLTVALCLILLQGIFWLVESGCIETGKEAVSLSAVAATEQAKQRGEAAVQLAAEPNKIEQAAKQVAAAAPNEAPPVPQERKKERKVAVILGVKFEHLAWLIRFLNFVLIPAAVLYCLTMLFSLKVSLVGRLGGINHISRAFFISLVMVVFLLPWYKLQSGAFFGAMYSPEELLNSCDAANRSGLFGSFFHYARFTGLWLVVVLLLICSQIRSARWAKTILRRLEVM
jgi:hypothetical protein